MGLSRFSERQMTLKLVPTERSCHKVYYVKYEGPNSYQSKDMANVKVFKDKQTGQKLYTPSINGWGGGGIKKKKKKKKEGQNGPEALT